MLLMRIIEEKSAGYWLYREISEGIKVVRRFFYLNKTIFSFKV
jgi:hypothetical protein